jgi:hypothetical protein
MAKRTQKAPVTISFSGMVNSKIDTTIPADSPCRRLSVICHPIKKVPIPTATGDAGETNGFRRRDGHIKLY